MHRRLTIHQPNTIYAPSQYALNSVITLRAMNALYIKAGITYDGKYSLTGVRVDSTAPDCHQSSMHSFSFYVEFGATQGDRMVIRSCGRRSGFLSNGASDIELIETGQLQCTHTPAPIESPDHSTPRSPS